jgi:hypothetical protein
LVGQQTGYPNSNEVLKERHAHRADLLRVWEWPEVLLHKNCFGVRYLRVGDEAEDRWRHTQREWPAMLGHLCQLQRTYRELEVRFWEYLHIGFASWGGASAWPP